MALSEDLMALEAWVACIVAGTHAWTDEGLEAFRLALGHAVERADTLERALDITAAQLSPARDHEALRTAVASGKVELLAAHRVRRLPDIPQPGWTA